MILISTSRDKCNEALSRYISQIKLNYLLIHKPTDIAYGRDFFDQSISKSKLPYQWGGRSNSNTNVPWLSFVGYQIRYDLSIRVRKKSIRKEVKKQQKEATDVLKAIYSKDLTKINVHSRKSLKQQLIALESRLIAMSVGRKKIYNFKKIKPSMCWTNGFKRLSSHATVRSQLRLLDSKRNRQLFIIKRKLVSLDKKAHNPDQQNILLKYSGLPFSYFGYISYKK
jgi:hypothetical protein